MRITTATMEALVLGEEGRLTLAEAARRGRATPAELDRIRLAAGLSGGVDEPARLTSGDVEALRAMRRLVESDAVTPREATALARTLGRSLSRAAEAVAPRLAGDLPDIRPAAARARLDAVDGIVLQVWRRHLLASLLRQLGAAADTTDVPALSVGFADLVGYTSTSRQLDLRELEVLLEAFEVRANVAASAAGARIVKSLGDEVLFVSEEPAAAVEVGLRLSEAVHAAEELSEVHVGISTGPVLTWQGDVYGEVVNAASRLTGLARPGSVLVHGDLAAALDGDRRFVMRPLRRLRLTRYGRWRPHVVEWAPGAAPA